LAAEQVSDSFKLRKNCRGDFMDCTACMEMAETGNFILLMRIKPQLSSL
jgi:hypothetical protein